MQKLFLDIETDGVIGHVDKLLLTGYALDDGPVTVLDPEAMFLGYGDQLAAYLADPEVVKVSHSTFDPKFLMQAGWEVNGPLVDTKVMAWVLNENTPLDLEWLSWRYAQIDMNKQLRRHAGRMYLLTQDGVETELCVMQGLGVEHPYWREFEDYNRRDVEALRDLFRALEERLIETEWVEYWWTEEVPYTRVLLEMELRGLPIDLEAVAALTPRVEADATRLAAELMEEGNLPPSFNLNSSQQLVAYLFSRVATFKDVLVYDTETIQCLRSCLDGEHDDCFTDDLPGEPLPGSVHIVDLLPEGFALDKLGRDRAHGHWTVKGRNLAETPPPVNKVTGEKGKLPSTSSPELLYLHAEDPWVRKLCTEYRKTEKLLTTYLRKFPVIAREGRIYGSYNQTGTVTGRLSSSGPNMQNMPARGERGKQVRSLFVGNFIIGDYDQLEMRIMASLSDDRRLTKVFREGGDPHDNLAYAIWGESIDVQTIPSGAACSYRDAAKTLNYAMGYGAGARKVAQTLSLLGFPTSPEVAKGYLAEMQRFYHGLFRWKDQTIAKAKRKGNVATLGGRRRRLRGAFKDTANWKAVGYGERQAVNAIVQGTAADVIRRAMVRLAVEAPEYPMLAQVHDELLFAHHGTELVAETDLKVIQHIAETGHGLDLKVPLVFEPSVARSWAEKGGKSMVDLFEDEDVE
jgi:DNA polymerase I-like protein with 3'-5' exonuclease and polymerase domains